MGTLRVNTITNITGTGAPNIPDSIKVAGVPLASANTMQYFSQSAEPTSPRNGAIWWNTATSKYSVYVVNKWAEIQYTDIPLSWYGDRAIFSSGFSSSGVNNNTDYIRISIASNAAAFSTMQSVYDSAACSNSVRAVFGGGVDSGSIDVFTMVYNTFATLSSATSFGNFAGSQRRSIMAGCSDGSRGLFAGGKDLSNTTLSSIVYITISTTGNSTTFGDLTSARRSLMAFSNNTYGVFAGGNPTTTPVTTVDYVTIATLGNATTFGNLLEAKSSAAGSSNSTRGIIGGGYTTTYSSSIEYFTINTPGNAISFGNIGNVYSGLASASNGIRSVFGGGTNGTTRTVGIEYVTIDTPSNATTFGNLVVGRSNLSAASGNY